MRLVVLGSGASVPDGSRNGPAFWVEDEDLGLMLDCGAGSLPSLVRHARDWTSITHVFLGHFHIDHVVELPALLFGLKHAPQARGRTGPLAILGPPGTADLVHAWEAALGGFLDMHFEVRLVDVEPGASHTLAGGALAVTPTPHTEESLAVRIDIRGTSLGYTGDTGPSPGLVPFFKGCDVLVADCSIAEPRDGMHHLSTEEAARLAADARVGHLVATHLYPEQDPESVRRKIGSIYGGKVIVARDGLAIEI